MKRTALIFILASIISLTSCSSDDDNSGGNEYPKIVNIKFDITTTESTEAIISRTLNSDTQTENIDTLPYSFTYAQQEVNQGTYLKLSFTDNLAQDGGPTSYEAELKISVGNEVVKSETFTITDVGETVLINYTFQ